MNAEQCALLNRVEFKKAALEFLESIDDSVNRIFKPAA